MECPHCQKPIDEGTRVCPFCCQAVDLDQPSVNAADESSEDQALRKRQAETAYRLAQKRREELSTPEGQTELRRALRQRRRELKAKDAIWPILLFFLFFVIYIIRKLAG